MQNNDVSIEIRDLTCRYQTNTVVEGLDLDIRKGEFFTLLGPSGCGKSTTLRTIAGFNFPASGSLRISGTDYTYAPPDVRPVNYVFQNYALFPHMSVLKNVAYGLRRQGVSKREAGDRALEELARVKMDGFAERLPAQLSGGQQQRVALARALVNRPEVLLLDEPLSAIDSQLRLALRAELTKLQQHTGITFVFVTHDQTEALSMSDRIGLMSGGRIVQLSTPREIYQRPSSRETAEFIGNSAIFDGELIRGPEDLWEFRVEGDEALALPDSVVERTTRRSDQIRHLVVKPEDIVLSPAASTGLTAEVVASQYQGADIALELRLRGGERIIVTRGPEALEGPDPLPEPGERVALAFRSHDRVTLL